ncbi:MAG: hypothetical protein A3205_02230 [Methanomassiliicoccales archaeon Mx-03]|nr:MAG: hypothetical protein A3205_02230 [Methanomassiliicoccales archaeon Mx-03]
MSRTRIGEILESANTVDILLYIHDHAGCYKSEIYQNVTRNAHTREKIESLSSAGLISISPAENGNGNILDLTDKGRAVMELLRELETILEDDD